MLQTLVHVVPAIAYFVMQVSATQMRSEHQSELAIRLKAKLASPAMLRRQGEA